MELESTTEEVREVEEEEEVEEEKMEKYTVRVNKKKKRKLRKPYKCKKSSKVSSVPELIKQAESHIDSFEYERAVPILKKALHHEPTNVKALDLLAAVFVELRNFDEAHNILLKIVELCPDDKYGSYFTLAQISEGDESVNYYKMGIQILERLLANKSQSKEAEDENLRRDLTNAYCSIAEIYMTDLCDDDDAEEQCRVNINNSLECGQTFPESHQCLANLLLILQKKEEAKEAIIKSLSLWLPQYRALGEEQCDSDEPFLVSYDFRLNTSKILIELQMYDEASEILDGLIDENDSVTETWYLLGQLNYTRGEMYWGNARYYFKKAIKLGEIGVSYDPEEIDTAKSYLAEMGPGSADEEDDENEENEAVDDNVDFDSDSGEEMED